MDETRDEAVGGLGTSAQADGDPGSGGAPVEQAEAPATPSSEPTGENDKD